MQLAELLRYINETHKTTFELIEQYAAGEQGAFALSDHLGRRYVLKWSPGTDHVARLEEARALTDRLRSVGYPTPHYLFIGSAFGGSYSIQAALPGSPMGQVTIAFLPRLLELNALQVGQALPGLYDWHNEAVNTVLFGGDGYCLHTSLKEYSQDTAELLHKLQVLVSAYKDEPHETNDVVHGDYQPSNILVHDQEISGVIDWEAACAGDCSFDIATLLFYSYGDLEVRKQLWQYALKRAMLNLLSVYIAHLILRQVDWSIRYHDEVTIQHFINRGNALLDDIAHRFRRSH